MLETLAIAALVVGGLSSSASLVADDAAVAEADSKTAAVEVHKAETGKTDNREAGQAKSAFLD
jgi:hypothetical protein